MGTGVCVEKIVHNVPTCGKHGLQVFQEENGTYNGYCFACGKFEGNPYGDQPVGYKPVIKKKSQEEIEAEIKEITDDFHVVDLPDRKLRAATLEHYGVKIGLSEQDGVTPTTHFYPYFRDGKLSGYKVRVIKDKRMWSVGDCTTVDLFGWDVAVGKGAKRLYITEGEIDALSLYQTLCNLQKGTQYEDRLPAVVSLPHGAGSAGKDLARLREKIRKHFQEIVLVFDMDEAGKKAVEAAMHSFPDATAASLPGKDFNQCVLDGRAKAAAHAVLFNSAKPKNSRIIRGADIREAAKKPAEYGVSWPWKHVTEATRGIRLGETIYIGAGQKQGKSEVVNQIAAHCIKEHGWKVFLCKPEEANNKTFKMVAGKMVGKFFHDPTKLFDEAAYDQAADQIGDSLYLLNLYQHVDFDTLKGDIRDAVVNEGVKAVFIDPITNFTNGMDPSSANTKLQEIAQELAAMALDLSIVIFIFCHLRNPDSGPSHERGGDVLSSQFAGSRAMARSCNLMLGLQGNRDPDLPPEERNLRNLVLLEDREFGSVGRFGLYWDMNTGIFNEVN